MPDIIPHDVHIDPDTGLVCVSFWSDEGEEFSFWSENTDEARARTVWIIQAWYAPFQIDE